MAALDFKLGERAIERIATAAALSVPGTQKQDAKLAGLAGRSLPRFVAFVDRNAGLVTFEADLAVQFPAPAKAVVEKVRHTVREHVHALTGLEVTRINITLASFPSAARAQGVSRTTVEAHPTALATRPVTVVRRNVHIPQPCPPPRVTHPTVRSRYPLRFSPPLAPPTPVELLPVKVPAPFPVRSPECPMPIQVERPMAPAPMPLRPISVPSFPVKPITVVPFRGLGRGNHDVA